MDRVTSVVTVSSRGRIAYPSPASEESQLRLRILDTLGRIIGRGGRQGRGPGELNAPTSVFSAGDSLIYVFDLSLLRLSAFRHNGEFVTATQFEEFLQPKAILGDSMDAQQSRQPDVAFNRFGIGSRTSARKLVTSQQPEYSQAFPVTASQAHPGSSRRLPSYAASPERIAIGNGRTYQILLYERSGRFLGMTGKKVEQGLPTEADVALFEKAARAFRFPDGRGRSEESITADVRRFRATPKTFFSHLRGLAFDGRNRLWVLGAYGDEVHADVFHDQESLGTIKIACSGFGDSFDLNGEWLVIVCANRDPKGPSDAALHLYHIEERVPR